MIWTILIGLVLVFFVLRVVRAVVSIVIVLALGAALLAYGGGVRLEDVPGHLADYGVALPTPGEAVLAAERWTACTLSRVQAFSGEPARRDPWDPDPCADPDETDPYGQDGPYRPRT
ncbi:hypothetical protein [Chthonobacter rhizosphaerae]|uniref:hypothetical protein n=1 Tax=Chthonobacter rhizosphaerae TaxID=2735553 RepID=UPI0015EF1CFC|nr:hypothetical protein [Chthonobacter rhizosphaerae]